MLNSNLKPLAWVAALLTVLMSWSVRSAEVGRRDFQPAGMWIWDNWFIQEGDTWHAFYLQLPKAVGQERRWKDNDFYKHVGHATSKNLVNWVDAGPALCALPGTWNDRHIATGSVLKHEGRWWMFFTGRGTKGDGVGLALSDDLTKWVTEPEPLFPLIDTFASRGDAPYTSTWQGQQVQWLGISDPYIHPEAVDGWFYMVLCSRILDVAIEESGALTLVRSRDLRHWEEAGILSWPRCFERMETPQVWFRKGQWHGSFGGVINKPWGEKNEARFPAAVRGRASHQNYSFAWSGLQHAVADERLRHIEVPKGCYIMKVLAQADGRDVALFTSTDERGNCLSKPYEVEYLEDGTLILGASYGGQ